MVEFELMEHNNRKKSLFTFVLIAYKKFNQKVPTTPKKETFKMIYRCINKEKEMMGCI